MRGVTRQYKQNIIKLGREFKIKLRILTPGSGYVEEDYSDKINNFSFNFEGDILKSVMKKIEFNFENPLSVNQQIIVFFGEKVNDNYEYVDLGRFCVYSVEKQEDTKDYHIVANDYMINAMKEYERLNITYPITIRNYLKAICNKIGLSTIHINNLNFKNYNKEIQNELYLDAEGNSLGYTFRDVLDEIAEATGSILYADGISMRLKYPQITEVQSAVSITGSSSNFSGLSIVMRDFEITLSGPPTKNVNFEATSNVTSTGYATHIIMKFTSSVINENLKLFVTFSDGGIVETSFDELNKTLEYSSFEPMIIRRIGVKGNATTQEYTTPVTITLNETKRFNNALIDERTFQDTNVNIGKKYGPINSVVLSRAGGSDNVYLRDEQSVTQNGLCEIKISDNQIMNFNDRDTYLQGILEAVDGLEYYIHNFATKGITYLEIGDFFDVAIGGNVYSCLMLNDEIIVDQGLEENIYVDEPETAETDYTKASKTDRLVRQTYLMVDKQNGKIEALADDVREYEGHVADLTIEAQRIDAKVESNYSFERTQTGNGSITIEEIQQNGLLELVISGIIDNLIVGNELVVGNNTILKDTTLVIENEDGEKQYIHLPINYLAQGDKFYWQLLFDNDEKKYIPKMKIVRNNGNVEIIDEELKIEFEAGQQTFYIQEFPSLNYIIKYAILNDMVGVFATQVQMNTEIEQTAEHVLIQANQYTQGAEERLHSEIEVTAGEISAEVERATAEEGELSTRISVTADGLTTKVSKNQVISEINQTAEQIKIQASKISLEGFTSINGDVAISNGKLNAKDGLFQGTITIKNTDAIDVIGSDSLQDIKIDNYGLKVFDDYGNYSGMVTSVNSGATRGIGLGTYDGNWLSIYKSASNVPVAVFTASEVSVPYGSVYAQSFGPPSLEELKKNIELYKDNALELIKKSEIYSYIYKTDEENHKKRYGFVIGENYKTPKEVISDKNNSIDLYSMCSILWKAVQEQQQEIEELKDEIKILKEMIK